MRSATSLTTSETDGNHSQVMRSPVPCTRQHAGYVLSGLGLLFILTYLAYLGKPFSDPLPEPLTEGEAQRHISAQRVLCNGPRGFLKEDSDDLVRSQRLNTSECLKRLSNKETC